MSVTPLHVGVEAVASGAALVLIPQTLLRGLLPLAVDLHDALGTECHICMDKDLQAVRCVLQNVIRAAAHNDAGPFCASSVMTLYTIAYKLLPISAKKRGAALQLDLRRNATRCTLIIAEAKRNFKWFFAFQVRRQVRHCRYA